MGTGLAKSTLQHALSSGTVALASKEHLFNPVLMLIIYISATNCSWEAFRHGHTKGSKKRCLLWWLTLRLPLQVGTLLVRGLGLAVSSQPLRLGHLPPGSSLPAFSSHLTPSWEAKRVTSSLSQLVKPLLCKEDVSNGGNSCVTLPPAVFRPAGFQAEIHSRT